MTGVFVNVVILRGPGRPVVPAAVVRVLAASATRRCRSGAAASVRHQGTRFDVQLVRHAVRLVAAGGRGRQRRALGRGRSALRPPPSGAAVPVPVLGAAALSVIDLFTFRLPDRITYPVLYASVPLLVVIALVEHQPRHILWALAGGLGYYGLLALMWLISPKGMGYGDVKLGRILGLYLGWIHIVLPIYGLGAAGILGSVVGIGVLLVSRDRRRGVPVRAVAGPRVRHRGGVQRTAHGRALVPGARNAVRACPG